MILGKIKKIWIFLLFFALVILLIVILSFDTKKLTLKNEEVDTPLENSIVFPTTHM
ncbi:MAG: hypothetical protein LBC61_04255 [Candidatus Peribacteria bacterium]|jgi:cell division protein FtsL|nr:hypothetical protein [Candidatus Peribacteria bacterium]